MRILIVATNFTPELTGSGLYTGEMAQWLADRGHEVTAVVGPPHYPDWRIPDDYRETPFAVERLPNLTVRRVPMFIPSAEKTNSVRRILMETSFTMAALRWIIPAVFSRERFDVAIAICPPMQTGVLPLLMSIMRRTPWVFHVQDLQVDAAAKLGMIKHRGAVQLLLAAERFLLKRATLVSTITEAMRRRVIEKGIDSVSTRVVPNWSDTNTYIPMPADQAVRAELNAGPNDVLFFYSGNIGEKQGLEVLLETARLVSVDEHIKFAIAGEGVAKARLQEQASELGLTNLVFRGLAPRDTFLSILNAADVHLVIQRSEAADSVMPSKLTNILSVGKPTIATASPGTTLYEVINDNGTGVTVEPESATALSLAIRRLASDGAARTAMSANARAYAEEFLDKRAILLRFEEELLELLRP